MSKEYRISLFLCSLSFAVLTACGGGAKLASPERVSLDDVPSWVKTPPESCAMGVATFRGDLNLGRKASVGRGREELSRQLQTKVAGLFKDYQSQGESGGEGFNEELITQVSRQLSTMTLTGTRARSWHVDEEAEPQQIYSLVCIEPELFANALKRMGALSAMQRERLQRSADSAFRELDQLIEQQQKAREREAAALAAPAP